jgi:hypothetical protein
LTVTSGSGNLDPYHTAASTPPTGGTCVAFTCDRCDTTGSGRRVVFTTEATDERGVDVTVEKRWVTCPSCADEVFGRIGLPSPWASGDGRTVAFPDDDDLVAGYAGGFAGALTR